MAGVIWEAFLEEGGTVDYTSTDDSFDRFLKARLGQVLE